MRFSLRQEAKWKLNIWLFFINVLRTKFDLFLGSSIVVRKFGYMGKFQRDAFKTSISHTSTSILPHRSIHEQFRNFLSGLITLLGNYPCLDWRQMPSCKTDRQDELHRYESSVSTIGTASPRQRVPIRHGRNRACQIVSFPERNRFVRQFLLPLSQNRLQLGKERHALHPVPWKQPVCRPQGNEGALAKGTFILSLT